MALEVHDMVDFDGALLRGYCLYFRCSAGFQPASSRQDGGATLK